MQINPHQKQRVVSKLQGQHCHQVDELELRKMMSNKSDNMQSTAGDFAQSAIGFNPKLNQAIQPKKNLNMDLRTHVETSRVIKEAPSRPSVKNRKHNLSVKRQ